MKSLKEKFGKFEMSQEQVKAVKGGESGIVTMGCPSQGCAAYWAGDCDSGGYAACLKSGCPDFVEQLY
jgi:hypothetical protein